MSYPSNPRIYSDQINKLRESGNGIQVGEDFRLLADVDSQIAYLLEKVVEKDARLGLDRFPLQGIVLLVQKGYCVSPFERLNPGRNNEDRNRGKILIKARIPEIHSSIPAPKKIGPIGWAKLDPVNTMRINMHHTYIGYVENDTDIPSPGDIVLLDYDNRASFTGGIYLGIKHRLGSPPADSSSPIFSGKRFFDSSRERNNKPNELKSKRERSLKGDFYQSPVTLSDYGT